MAGYGDSNKNIRNWRIALAEAALDQGEWEKARAWLEPIADHSSAQKLMRRIEKAEAAAQKAPEASAEDKDAEAQMPPEASVEDADAEAEREESGEAGGQE